VVVVGGVCWVLSEGAIMGTSVDKRSRSQDGELRILRGSKSLTKWDWWGVQTCLGFGTSLGGKGMNKKRG